jgi:hypothetical protein
MSASEASATLTVTGSCSPSCNPNGSFVTYGVLDLRNPDTVATNSVIQGNYVGGANSVIDLNAFGVGGNTGQANHLAISGSVSGASSIVVTPFNGALAGDPPPFTVANISPGLADYSIREVSPGQFDLYSTLNTVPIASIVNGLQSAVESVTTGLFEGLSTVFLRGASPSAGAPPKVTPNGIDAGVWTRGASGMNTEISVATDNLGSLPTSLTHGPDTLWRLPGWI